ncbi:MAG: FkbM family methyltransferase [Opitutaceae bacterium]|nr:FkbM family methyltransferase [Opitutaceae bacterium]
MHLLQKIIKKAKKTFHGNRYTLSKYHNLTFLFRATNHIDRQLLWGGNYEEQQITKAISLIKKHNVEYFIDVGANIGIYSIRIASACKSLKQVFSVEAQIENYNQLCANIRLNNLDRVIHAKNIGASNQYNELEFLVNKGNSTGTSRVKSTAPTSTKLRKFNSDTIIVDQLDNIIGKLEGSSIFIKIDVEGHEKQVLEGMKGIIKTNKCLFQIELLDDTCNQITNEFNLVFIEKINTDFYFQSS